MKRGFTLIEMMVGLTFSGMLMILLLTTIRLTLHSKNSIELVDQNEIGMIQLQHEMNFASNISYSDKRLCYYRLENDFCLVVENNRLVKHPGYEILLIDFNSLSITLNENLHIEMDGDNYVIKLIH